MLIKKMYFLILFIAIVGAASYVWATTSRDGYESAEYDVIETDSSFEIREYPDLMLASTGMKIDAQGRDGSFGRLFRYISGKNEADQKIAMTTPVFMEPGDESAGEMGFVLPKKVAETAIPDPTAEQVQIKKRAGGRFAVVTFPGRANEQTRKENEAKLREWVESKQLKMHDQVEFASYDPPWTPGPFRRNEVLIRLK